MRDGREWRYCENLNRFTFWISPESTPQLFNPSACGGRAETGKVIQS